VGECNLHLAIQLCSFTCGLGLQSRPSEPHVVSADMRSHPDATPARAPRRPSTSRFAPATRLLRGLAAEIKGQHPASQTSQISPANLTGL
jgi:hypothetical protein